MMFFEKYECCGNDFIIMKYLENIDYNILAKTICERKYSIGADGLICYLEEPLELLFFNADGSEAKICGNGLLCFARYAIDKLNINTPFFIHTKTGCKEVVSANLPNIRINLGNNYETSLINEFTLNGKRYNYSMIDLGNKHIVINEKSLFMTEDLINKIRNFFNDEYNINFYEVCDYERICVKTYERGVGFTNSCGSGSVSCALTAYLLGQTKKEVTVCHKNCSHKVIIEDNLYLEAMPNKVYSGEILC